MTAISVVLPVYNGAVSIAATIESIQAQSVTDFELIVVDDGSTDATPEILRSYSVEDRRIRIIQQDNCGITRALIRGCEEALSPLIARHDCGDRSRRERFGEETQLFERNAAAILVACGTRYSTNRGEWLYTVTAEGSEVRRSLRNDGISSIRGLPHHGSAMFRRDAYRRAGGYRAQFYFAQDLDLWIRMAALGEIEVIPEALYEASLDINAISSRNRDAQVESARIAIAIRDKAKPEAELLQVASHIRPTTGARGRLVDVKALYFIASCLRKNKNHTWTRYLWQALRRMMTLS
jgi:glycosyltransferase involved in cell wall biosynthesis